ncbi:hypothetical protein JKF63_04586 [Porcisia hertigi]|uniref:Uncharacterized protein n=1 Tax=Porcisia hertigi TaxID=2761500 RepID=A0A836IKI7_9TRYP|nr:hypothetical protein JKF63_04586 [Porcisia hertigi]
MGSHVTRASCSTAFASVVGKSAAPKLSTYTGVSLDALVDYERAALHLSHNLDDLQHSAATATESAPTQATASTPTSGSGPTAVSQPPRRPLFLVDVGVQYTLQKRRENKQHRCKTNGDDGVAVKAAYCDGVPVLLQELAWEWSHSTQRKHQRSTTAAARPPAFSGEQMATWCARTSQLLRDFVSSRRYEKAMKRTGRAVATDARVRTSVPAVRRHGEISSDGEHRTPRPIVFRELFQSYAVLSRSLTTQHGRTATLTAGPSSSAGSTHSVTPSMWCAVLCQFLCALPEPLMPSLCSRRLEPLAGKPSSGPSAATVSTSSADAVHVAVRRVVKQSFLSTDVVAYTTFCFVLNLVHRHRAELSGGEVEAVARAVVRASSLVQLTREVAHACKPEVRIFFPPLTRVDARSAPASAAAAAAVVVQETEPREDVLNRDELTAVVTASSPAPASTPPRAEGCAAPLVQPKAAAGATAVGNGAPGQPTSRMAPPRDEDTSSESERVTAEAPANDARGRPAEAQPAASTSFVVAAKASPVSATPSTAGGMMRQPATSPSSATASDEDDSDSERYPLATATHDIPVAAQRTEEARHTSPIQQQGFERDAAIAESPPQRHPVGRVMISTATPLTDISPLRKKKSGSPLSDHRCRIAQLDVKPQATRSDDQDMQPPCLQTSRPELSPLTASKLGSALYPSALEVPAAAETETKALLHAFRLFTKHPLPATPDGLSKNGEGDDPHSRSPSGRCDSPQSFSIVSARMCAASRPPQWVSSPQVRHATLTTNTFLQDERQPVPGCGSAPAPLSTEASAAPLPVMAYRAQAEKPLLTALMVAKQRFLAAPTPTPSGETSVTPSPSNAAGLPGRSAAAGGTASKSGIDHRLESVMTYSCERVCSSAQSPAESLKATSSSPHEPSLQPDALGPLSDRRDLPERSQRCAEEPHPTLRKCTVVCDAVHRTVTSSDILSGMDSSPAEHCSHDAQENQQPHVSHRGAGLDGALSPTAIDNRDHVAGAGHAHVGAPFRSHEGHMSSSVTTPLKVKTALPTNPAVGVPDAQQLKGLVQELEKLRHVVRTLESQQFVQVRQASAQTSELQAQCLELQHQQREQGRQLCLTHAQLRSVGKELEDLRSVRAHLQMQLAASQQESARLRDSLLFGVANT